MKTDDMTAPHKHAAGIDPDEGAADRRSDAVRQNPDLVQDTVMGIIAGLVEDDKRVAGPLPPALLYETVKGQLFIGEFDDDPTIKTVMENFVIGAERTAPGHFGVKEPLYMDHVVATRGEDLNSGLPEKPGTAPPAAQPALAPAPKP